MGSTPRITLREELESGSAMQFAAHSKGKCAGSMGFQLHRQMLLHAGCKRQRWNYTFSIKIKCMSR